MHFDFRDRANFHCIPHVSQILHRLAGRISRDFMTVYPTDLYLTVLRVANQFPKLGKASKVLSQCLHCQAIISVKTKNKILIGLQEESVVTFEQFILFTLKF